MPKNIIPLSQRELLLGAIACTMAGVVIGMLLSPRRTVTLFSHNGTRTQTIGPAEESPDKK